jgi:hypothetical protein
MACVQTSLGHATELIRVRKRQEPKQASAGKGEDGTGETFVSV